MSTAKPIVLVCIGSHWPGAASNGPVKSIDNLVEALSAEFEFRMIARDRPFGAAEPAGGVAPWTWAPRGQAHILYVPAPELGVRAARRLLASTAHDLLYLNGFFDRELTVPLLVARRLAARPDRRPVVVAPRGEFAAGTGIARSRHKQLYIATARRLGLLRGATLQASTTHDAADIRRVLPEGPPVLIAPNIADAANIVPRAAPKTAGAARLVFVGRISPMKNLEFALDVLARVKSPVTYDICGPIEDAACWARCEDRIRALPAHVTVRAHGQQSKSQLAALFAQADALFLPTLGENFGHAIVEALSAGLPVILSDRSPWRDLSAQGCGWSLPLEAPEKFVGPIEEVAQWGANAWTERSERARAFAAKVASPEAARVAHRQLFLHALAGR